MPINPHRVGHRYPATPEFEVGREAVREFATALGDNNPCYHNVDTARDFGHPDLVAPPTFAFVLGLKALARIITDPRLGVDYARVVHGGQRFEYARPIHAGDVLVAESQITEIVAKGPNEYVTAGTDLSTSEGELVVRTWQTLVSRGTAATIDAVG